MRLSCFNNICYKFIVFYEEVFRKLSDREVKYAVAGGVALVLHGVVRLTADLDLIVELSTRISENLLQP